MTKKDFTKFAFITSLALVAISTFSCFNGDDKDRDINSGGVSSSSGVEDQSLSSSSLSGNSCTFSDVRDGKTYKCVSIGSQTWMAENLNYRAEGSLCYGEMPCPAGEYCEPTPPYILENCEKFGRLYKSNPPVNCINGTNCTGALPEICPFGWRLPSNAEWQQLVNFATNGSIGTLGFNGNDTYGFAALPGGYFIIGEYTGINEVGSWLTSTPWQWVCPAGADCVHPLYTTGVYVWHMTRSSLINVQEPYSSLHSIRCIANEPINATQQCGNTAYNTETHFCYFDYCGSSCEDSSELSLCPAVCVPKYRLKEKCNGETYNPTTHFCDEELICNTLLPCTQEHPCPEDCYNKTVKPLTELQR